MPQKTPHPAQPDPRRDSSRQAVFVFLALAAFSVWGLGVALESRVEDRRVGGLRNPHSGRDWLHHAYEAAPRREGERLFILISNSQGYGRSVPDERTYAALLERQLAAQGDGPVRVLNWSIPGGVAPEFVVLGAAAYRLDPTLVLVLSSRGNFADSALVQDGRDTPPAELVSDVYHLTAYSDVRSHVPEHFRASYLDSAIRLDALLARASRLWRYRDMDLGLFPSSWWTKALRQQEVRVRRAEKQRGARRQGGKRQDPGGRDGPRRTFALAASPEGLQPSAGVKADAEQARLELLEDLLAAGPESRLVLIQMPLRASGRLNQDRFGADARRLAGAAHVEFWDLSKAVPNNEFESPAHFTAAGHLRFSKILTARLGS